MTFSTTKQKGYTIIGRGQQKYCGVAVGFHRWFHGRLVTSFYTWGFLKWWYPTTMGFPTKNDHFGVFWGYHHLRKHPHTHCRKYSLQHALWIIQDTVSPSFHWNISERFSSHWKSLPSLRNAVFPRHWSWQALQSIWNSHPAVSRTFISRVLTTHILYIHICAILCNHTLGSHQITGSNCPFFPGFPLEVDLPTFQFCGFADFRFRIWFKCICISSFRKWSWCTIPCSTLLWEPSLPNVLCMGPYWSRIRRYNRITKCRNAHWGWLSKSPWWTIRGLLLSGQFR